MNYRIALIVMNCILFIYGILILVIGSMLCVYLSCTTTVFLTIFAVLLFMRSIIGIIAFAKTDPKLILIYVVLIPALWIVCLCNGAMLWYYYQTGTAHTTNWLMKTKMSNEKYFHDIEREYWCCGVKNATEYIGSHMMDNKTYFENEIIGSCCYRKLKVKKSEMKLCMLIAMKRDSCTNVIYGKAKELILAFCYIAIAFSILEVICWYCCVLFQKKQRAVT